MFLAIFLRTLPKKICDILVFMAKKGSKQDIFQNFQPVKFRSLPVQFQLCPGLQDNFHPA